MGIFSKISRQLFCVIMGCLYATINTAQINIDVNGFWDYQIPNLDISEAGNNFIGIYESGNSQIYIDIVKQQHSQAIYRWQVDVKKSDIDWPSGLVLMARRTGDGNPTSNAFSSVTGGTTYIPITSTEFLFFTGVRGRLNIPIQYRIQNASVLMPAKTYSTTVIYTVTEL